MFATIDRIEKLYNKNPDFKKSIDARLKDNDSKFYILAKNVNDYLLKHNESFNISNFCDYFFEALYKTTDEDFQIFVEGAYKNKHTSITHIYDRILSDINNNISNKYDLDIQLIKENRTTLENEAEKAFQSKDISRLFKIRKFLNENFRIDGFNSFIRENKNFALRVLRDVKIPQDDKKFIRLEQLLSNNRGYLGIFTYFLFKRHISYERLKDLYESILKNKDILDRLPKSVVSYKSFEELEDDIRLIERDRVAIAFAREYPRLKSIQDNKTFIEMANELKSMMDKDPRFESAYRKIFMPKISLYKTEKQLLDALEKFIFNCIGVDDFMSDIQQYQNEIKVVYDSVRFLVLRYLDYPALNKTCSDTNWCIARDRDYWAQYHGAEGRIFIVIIDKYKDKFDIRSKTGVTFESGGHVYASHLKNDAGTSSTEINKILKEDDVDLNTLYSAAQTFGSNTYYETEEDEYGNITGYRY